MRSVEPAWTGGGNRVRVRRVPALSGKAQLLAEGVIGPEDLDDEELVTGRFRMENGALGPRPKAIPREMHQELMRRLLERGSHLWQQAYLDAIRAVTEIATDMNNAPEIRLKAATYIIGKLEPDKIRVEISAEDPVEALFRAILNDPGGLQDDPEVVRGDVVANDAERSA